MTRSRSDNQRTTQHRQSNQIVHCGTINEWMFWETYISQFKTWGFDLINYTNGGGGCTFANQTGFKGHTSWLGKNHSEETKK
jgi:hypothetical protein